MPLIRYLTFDGNCHDIDVETGWNLMEGAVRYGVPGIDGDCGGSCACATCHVRVAPEWLAAAGERTDVEAEMLEFAENVGPSSRLACQIIATAELDGLILHLPESQY